PRETLERLAGLIGSGRRVSFWWTMGVNQSHEGVRVAQALICLALLTGNLGKPGTGANSITGQCNAMGSRLFSNTTSLLGGHDFTVAAHREKIAGKVGIPVERIPDQPSLAYDQILEGIHRGKIRGLWVIATNTAHSWINQRDARELLGRLDLLVVQDMYDTTDTARAADILLPAAGWGEKEGTFINSERRLSLVKRVSPAPGEALADFFIVKLVAEATGCGDLFRRFQTPEDVFHLLRDVSRGQPCDISGVRGYDHLAEARGIQWPLPEGEEVAAGAERRLFADGRFFHAGGKAKFCFGDPRPPGEQPSPEFPLRLLTGRGTSSQWHTQTRTSKSEILRQLYPEHAYVEVNPEDARPLSIRPGQWVAVESARGVMRARAFITPTISAGQVFVPMHYEGTNRLTFAEFDPMSRQPSYKSCAVRLSTDPVVVEGAA
ncbi:MAG: molybdopterin oxidoreductase family protein, partial [Deltaproteobacteria bacterium]|nr:molybdopterin oxidoreductase family protein [Deltaproteobacteria bacterium]